MLAPTSIQWLRPIFLGGWGLLVILFLGCESSEPTAESNQVFVTLAPQEYLVRRLAGDRVEVAVMVPPGQPEETYEPTPEQITRLSRSRIYFSIGVPFEVSFLERVRENVPHLSIIDTTEGIEKREIEEHSHEEEGDHGHEHEHAHDHGIEDPHVWLDPILMIRQAETMTRALSQAFPESRPFFEENLKSLTSDLEKLDRKIATILEPYKGKPMYVLHPSYGYFCDRYGLIQVPVESAGKEPNSKEFVELIRRAKEDQVTSLFVQPQFASSTADVLATEIGAKVVRIDHLSKDVLANLESMATKIAESYRPGAANG